MSVNTSGLRTEILTDPQSLGYSTYVSGAQAGNDNGIVSLINSVISGNMVYRTNVQPKEVMEAILPIDFAGMAQIQLSRLNTLFYMIPIDATLSGVRASFTAVFSGASYSGTRNALSIMSQRAGSRAETLFGTDTVVSQSDVSFALRGTR